MLAIPAPLVGEVKAALERSGRDDLVARLEACEPPADALTSGQAATLLGVSSPNTVKNWLEAGHFPGAFKTAGGHWRFLRKEVEAAKERMDALREKNRAGDLTPPDSDGDLPPLPRL